MMQAKSIRKFNHTILSSCLRACALLPVVLGAALLRRAQPKNDENDRTALLHNRNQTHHETFCSYYDPHNFNK